MACQHRTSLPLHINSNQDQDDDYNLWLHIFGIFTLLATSSLGVLIPLLATKDHSFQLVPALALTLGRQFGTGVILATALIHMLPTAMSNLSSPCLGDFFAKDYPALGGLLVLTSSLVMHWIEFMATEFNQARVRDPASTAAAAAGSGVAQTTTADQNAVLIHSHLQGLALLSDAQKRISTYILEAGVAAHSVIIGVALGVSSGSEFIGLLIALLFHQFFEGFALGARIADLDPERTSIHYLLALIFALTTPTGVMIGTIISRHAYHSDSVTSLLVEGVLDAISTGILLYMGYVTLLAVEFNLNRELLRQTPRIKSWCFFALWTGAGVMAVLGRFA
ncbi:zinc/iron permease [Linnemannia elongata]|nr:zinc/iron permease [Linnemannia elongata]